MNGQTLSENPDWSFNTLNHKTRGSTLTKTKRRAYRHYQKCTAAANLKFLASQVEGFSINFCCGRDPNGDVKVDLDKKMLHAQKRSSLDTADYVVADIHFFPFRENCCDTLIVDPPFSFFCRLSGFLIWCGYPEKRYFVASMY
jgi:hypothetical protein